MPTKKSRHALNKKRLRDFDDNLESLLKSTQFRSLKDLFKSKPFKSITLQKSKRQQEGEDIKLDAFYKTAVNRCTNNVASRAYTCCLKAIGQDIASSKRHARKPRAASELPACVTRSKSSKVTIKNSVQEKEKSEADASHHQKGATEPNGNKLNKEKEVAHEQHSAVVVSVAEELELPIGLKNFNFKTCYAVSSWRILSMLDSLYEKLAEVHDLQLEHDSLCSICLELVRSLRIGDKMHADEAFESMLNALGQLLPDWQDLTQLQDADEFIEVTIRQLELECSAFGIDLHSDLFGCSAACSNCTLDQQAQGAVKRCSLQSHYSMSTSEIITQIVAENICNCLACYGTCHCTSLPRNIFARLNRHDLKSKLLSGAKLNVEEEVHLDFNHLAGSYKLRGAILYHERRGTDNHYSSLMWQPQSHSYIVLDDEDVRKVSQSAAMDMMQKEAYLLHYELLGPSHHEKKI